MRPLRAGRASRARAIATLKGSPWPPATHSGCTTGNTGSPRWTTTAWCVRWSGGRSGQGSGPAATDFGPVMFLMIPRNSSSTTIAASSGRATIFIRMGGRPTFAWNAGKFRFSPRAKCRTPSSKPRSRERLGSFCDLGRRSRLRMPKMMWSTRAGFRCRDAAPWCCCPTGTRMQSPTSACARC
jgi:hypothetical protein